MFEEYTGYVRHTGKVCDSTWQVGVREMLLEISDDEVGMDQGAVGSEVHREQKRFEFARHRAPQELPIWRAGRHAEALLQLGGLHTRVMEVPTQTSLTGKGPNHPGIEAETGTLPISLCQLGCGQTHPVVVSPPTEQRGCTVATAT